MENAAVIARMRQDWDARAAEDAHYYVAFGGRDQSGKDFEATASEMVRSLEQELRRLPAHIPLRSRRGLEIGCGPGRLLLPLSRHFGEIHGVDISAAMIERARQRLADIPFAHVHVTPNSNLEMFAGESFDFVYSYAVFQHIPSRDVVMGYLREACRVLKPGGVIRCQINGLPEASAHYDTWSGVRIRPEELRQFSAGNGLDLLALEGAGTQYMWATFSKPVSPAPAAEAPAFTRIRRVSNAETSEPVAPSRGRYAAVALWVDNLPAGAQILDLAVEVNGEPGTLTYIGASGADGLSQVNLRLPADVRTGLATVALRWRGELLGKPRTIRILPPPARVPRVIALSDGINLVNGARIESGTLKLTVEEVTELDRLHIELGDVHLANPEFFCTDPIPPRYEVNCHLPPFIVNGYYWLRIRLDRRIIGREQVEIVRA